MTIDDPDAPIAQVIALADFRARKRGAPAIETEREAEQRRLRALEERIAERERGLGPEGGDAKARRELASLRRNHAMLTFFAGEPRKALDALDTILDEHPDFVEARVSRAFCRDRGGDAAGAIADYDHALGLSPRDPNLYFERGRCHLWNGAPGRARADFLRLVHDRPRDASALEWLAKSYDREGDRAVAIRILGRAIKLAPSRADLLVSRGACYSREDAVESALHDLDRALELDPRNVEALSRRSSIYRQRDQRDRELADLSRLLAIKPDDTLARHSRALCHAWRGEHALSVADYTHALSIEPNCSIFRKGRAAQHLALCAFDEAIVDLTRLVELEHGHAPEALWLRGHAHRRRGDEKAALEDYETALIYDDTLFDELCRTARRHRLIGAKEALRDDLGALLLLSPSNPDYLAERAALFAEAKEPALALADLDRALALDAERADLYHARADVHRALGATVAAIEDESRAIALAPRIALYWAWRGFCRALLDGPSKEAEADIVEAVRLDPESQIMRMFEQEYRTLEGRTTPQSFR